jgi:endonuclease-3 related protein
MVGAILTQNTAWTNVEKAIRNLKRVRKLSFRAFLKIPKGTLARLIRPAGYYNIKADRLKHFVGFLDRECGGDLTKLKKRDAAVLRGELLQVKGIGPETADSILLYALDKAEFVIDAYTKRVFSRHRLAGAERGYHEWKKLFERALPRELGLFNDFHAQIVRLAKEFCRTKPDCRLCPLRKM